MVQERDDQRLLATARSLTIQETDQRGVPQMDAVKHAYRGHGAARRQAVVFTQ
jgi:hypothetical protein